MLWHRLFWNDLKTAQWKYAVRWWNPHPKEPWEMTGFVISFWLFRVMIVWRADKNGRW